MTKQKMSLSQHVALSQQLYLEQFRELTQLLLRRTGFMLRPATLMKRRTSAYCSLRTSSKTRAGTEYSTSAVDPWSARRTSIFSIAWRGSLRPPT